MRRRLVPQRQNCKSCMFATDAINSVPRSMDESTGLRERKRERTRKAIAEAALELFARQGFPDTTIPQIAETADVSPRTVSGYFPVKEDLAFPYADAQLAAFERRLDERAAGETAA